MRVLTAAGAPAWHPAPEPMKQAGAKIVKLCRARRVDPAVLALRFCLDHPYVASTFVGMSSAREVEQNVEALDISIDTELMAEIEQIVAPVKDLTWASGRPENSDV